MGKRTAGSSNKTSKKTKHGRGGQGSHGAFGSTADVTTAEDDQNLIRKQIRKNGLLIRKIGDDGNCLFRAVGYQKAGGSSVGFLNGEELHEELRFGTVDFMDSHREDFEPFLDIDGEGSYDKYAANMRQDGVWGGNLEISAMSRLLKVHFYIFQARGASYEVLYTTDSSAEGDEKMLSEEEQNSGGKNGGYKQALLKNSDSTGKMKNMLSETEPEPATMEDRRCFCLAYSGGEHFDAVVISEEARERCQNAEKPTLAEIRSLVDDPPEEAVAAAERESGGTIHGRVCSFNVQ